MTGPIDTKRERAAAPPTWRQLRRDRLIFGLLVFLMTAANVTVAAVGVADIRADNRRQDEAAVELGRALDALQQEVAEREAQTAVNRTTSCEQQRAFALAHNGLVERTIELLRRVSGGSTRPETIGFLEEEIAAYETELVDVRACDPESQAAYQASGGAEGLEFDSPHTP